MENEIEQALVNAKVIFPSKDISINCFCKAERFLTKHKISRSSRVDKYVSAMSWHMSLKLPKVYEDPSDLKDRLLEHLPEDIKLWDL